MSTIDIPRSYHHYHLSVTITHALSNVTQKCRQYRKQKKRRSKSREMYMHGLDIYNNYRLTSEGQARE